MAQLLVAWAVLLITLVVFAIGRPGGGGALTLAYFLGLSLIHVPGVLPFLDGESGLSDWEETQLGFDATMLALAAFVAGAVLARRIRGASTNGALLSRRGKVFERLGWRTFTLGIVAYFVLLPLAARIASLTSVVAALGTLLILGLWLALYGAVVAGDRLRVLATLALLPLLPLATLVTGGFLGYGVYWVLSIIAFLFVISRRRIWFYLSAPAAMFLGLSLFVTYIGQRADIREAEWQEHVGMLDRLDRISAIATEFELLDLSSPTQVAALDNRLNQNALVGAAIIYHEAGGATFAYGGTIPVWALVPRAVWPDKPDVGGGGNIVTDFTGIPVAEGTSYGAGQVLEFYANFGIAGVLIGFFGLGCLLMQLDQGIMRSLAADDMRGLLLRAMPGLMLLQPGGNILEILVGCVAAYLGAHLVISSKFLHVPSVPRSRRQPA